MRKAQIGLDAAVDAERKAIDHISDDKRWSEPTVYQPYDHINDACEALSRAIETLRVLTGLPPNQKIGAVSKVIEEEGNRADAETPEVLRLKGERNRIWEQAN